MKICILCPTFNIYGGGEFVAASIANTLAENNYEVILFSNEEISQREIEKFFGKHLNPSIKVIVKHSIVQTRGLLDFYQTIFRSCILKSSCDILIDVYSNCVFPWTNIAYIHFPFFNHYFYRPHFPYIKSRRLLPIGGLPYVLFEKNLVNYNGKLILANSQYTANEIRRFSGKKQKYYIPQHPPPSSTTI
ncbi:MAG: hypothetical protein QXK89_08020 [Candidatus Bathyarchaeia archaeon]